jgi:hypothetical protein
VNPSVSVFLTITRLPTSEAEIVTL